MRPGMTPSMANIHVVPHGELWAVTREGTAEPLSTHRTEEQAVVAGRATARADKAEFALHGHDGRIRERDSYGYDLYDAG